MNEYTMMPFRPDPDWYRRYWLDERTPSPTRKAVLTFAEGALHLLRLVTARMCTALGRAAIRAKAQAEYQARSQ